VTTTTPRPESGPRGDAGVSADAPAAADPPGLDPGREAAPGGHRAARRRTAHDDRIRGLDGLRALAVVAVIAYHLWPTTLPGGYLGVDVFFVVSGFLITTLLLRQMARTGNLDMPGFWRRRARRLLPALGAVLVVGTLAARLVEPDLLVGSGRQWLGALTFSTNWLEIAAGTSYFDATQPELFQPLWSLAIEEQFYLVWPLVLVGLVLAVAALRLREGARLIALVVAGAAVLSAVAMALVHAPGDDPTRVYYGTGTHAFGLLAGAALAIGATGRRRVLPDTTWARALPWAGLAVLLVLVLTLRAEGTFAYRGGIALGSLAALALVAACAHGRSARFLRVLEMRPAVWVGERSYGLYLWHWPVILVVAAQLGDTPGSRLWWRTALVALVASFGLAALSHRYLEQPVRRDGFRATLRGAGAALREGRVAPRVAAGTALVLGLGSVLAMATAPDVTSTQRAIEAAQREIQERSGPSSDGTMTDDGQDAPRDAKGGEPAAGTDPGPTPGSTPGDDPTPTGGATGAPDGTGLPDAAALADGSAVVGFGDSVLSAAAPALYDVMPQIALDAKPIRKWLDAPDVVRAAQQAGTLRPVVLLNFGTNGGFQFDGSAQALDETLDLIGADRTVLIFTVVGVSYWVDDANAELAERVADRPNVHVVDWHGYVTRHPGLLHSDRTHPNMTGIAAYADLLRTTLADVSHAS